MELKINQKFKEILPPLSDDELKQLEESILSDGVRESVKVWQNTIIDGHNRHSICQKHDLPYPVQDLFFADEDEALEWIFTNQLGRRNLNHNQKTHFIGELYNLQKKRIGAPIGNSNAEIKVATVATLISEKEEAPELSYEFEPQFQPKPQPKKTETVIAKQFGVSPRTVRNAAKVATAVNNLPPEQKQDFLQGKISQKEVIKQNLTPEQKNIVQKKDEIKNDAGAKWRDATYKIYLLLTSVSDNGGIEKLASKWNSERRQYWRDELRKLESKIGEFADILDNLKDE